MREKSLAAVGWLLVAATVFAGVTELAWNGRDVDALRKLDKPAVAELLNDLRDTAGPVTRPQADEIGEFTWADLAGDGRYELVLTYDVNGRRFYNALIIYTREASGKLSSQEIRGWAIRDLGKVVRDLDGDGKDELIVPSQLASDTYRGASGMAIWPVVYRLKNGRYVEASSEFREFYEKQVLPRVEKKIAEAREKIDVGLLTEHALAIELMARDKVLRVIGRDARAGETKALEWMRSEDPELRMDAAAVLGDIGGHEGELRALSADKDPRVVLGAKFGVKHGAHSLERFNSAPASGEPR